MALIKPKHLKSGDTVAVVSPSWGGPATFPHRYESGKRQLEEIFGLRVIETPNALKPAEWIAKNPQARAHDLMDAFSDPTIHGIIASIGGDDSIRLLPHMDLDIIRHNPKVFMGYSDTTIIHFMCMKSGLASFYGPSIMAGFGENAGLFPYMKDNVQKTLFETDVIGIIPPAPEWTVEFLDWSKPENQTIPRKRQHPLGRKLLQGKGICRGHLIGGCIDVFPMLLGQSIWPEQSTFNSAILFLETSEEAPATDDFKRILRNLGVQGILRRLNGIILGRPGGKLTADQLTRYDEALLDVIRDEFGLEHLALLTQMDFGHTDPMFILPYGARAEINCDTLQFSILESGVV